MTAFRRRVPFGVVLSAYLVSVTCTAVSAIAIPWLVLSTTGSATRTGLVVFAEMAPYVAAQAVGGPWVERIGPRRVSWSANLGAGATLLLVPTLFATGTLEYASLIAVVGVVGALRGLADCGSAPLVPGAAAVAGMPLERAAGLHSSANQAGYLLGTPLAAVLLSVLAPPLVLLVSAGGFLVSGLLVGALVPSGIGVRENHDSKPEPYLRRIAAGISFLMRDRVLRAVVVMVAVSNLMSSAFSSVLLPSWVRDSGLPVAAVGIVAGSFGIGALGGSLLGAWLVPRLDRWLVYAVGFLIGGSPLYLGLLLSDSLVPAAVVAMACGLASGGINPVIGAVQYERVPAAMLARVLGTVKAVAWAGLPIGPVLAGVLTDASGIRGALAVLGGFVFVLTLTPFVVPAFRGLRRTASD